MQLACSVCTVQWRDSDMFAVLCASPCNPFRTSRKVVFKAAGAWRGQRPDRRGSQRLPAARAPVCRGVQLSRWGAGRSLLTGVEWGMDSGPSFCLPQSTGSLRRGVTGGGNGHTGRQEGMWEFTEVIFQLVSVFLVKHEVNCCR